MLAYFPVPYPDELLYSVIARYALHTGQNIQKAVIRDVFGSNSAAAVADMPSHIDQLISSTKIIWRTDPESIISRNTLAPLYLPFLAPEKADAVIASMRSTYGGNIHTRSGISASTIKQPVYLRYCPKCIEEQINFYGESYWKRQNQITGLEFCAAHKSKLFSSNIEFHPKSKHLFVPAALAKLDHQGETVSTVDQQLLLSKHIENLLNGSMNIRLTYWQWSMFYRDLANNHGLVNGKFVDHSRIHHFLERNWQNTLLSAQIPSKKCEYSWLVNIFRKHKASFHPIRHAMVWVGFAPELT